MAFIIDLLEDVPRGVLVRRAHAVGLLIPLVSALKSPRGVVLIRPLSLIIRPVALPVIAPVARAGLHGVVGLVQALLGLLLALRFVVLDDLLGLLAERGVKRGVRLREILPLAQHSARLDATS